MYPDLHMPFAPSWSLHWVYRDGHLVNLPVSLLVEGDVVALRPGQESFTSLRGIKVTPIFLLDGNDDADVLVKNKNLACPKSDSGFFFDSKYLIFFYINMSIRNTHKFLPQRDIIKHLF